MIIGQVIGSAVATLKLECLKSAKILLVMPADANGKASGEPFLAVDLVGAGEGELVMVSQGSSARVSSGNASSSVDAAIVGILDSLEVGGNFSFRKE